MIRIHVGLPAAADFTVGEVFVAWSGGESRTLRVVAIDGDWLAVEAV